VSNVINITCPEAEGTIDQHIGGLVETKRRNFHAAMNKGEAQPVWNEGAFAKELAEMIVQKHREKKVKKGVTVTTNITAVASF
jgi:hypothetical protein